MRSGPIRSVFVLALALGIAVLGVGLVTGSVLVSARAQPGLAPLPPAPKPYVVAIAPGHGGYDPGAISPYNGLKEKNVTLAVGLALRQDLEAQGVRVAMTRTNDVDRTISQDEQIALKSKANLFISLWVNDWVSNPSLEGSTVFFPHQRDMPFASKLATSLAAAIKPYGMASRTTQPLPQLWVHSPMPTVTIETGFMSNLHDSELLAEPSFRDVIAQGISNGVLAYAPQIPALHQRLLLYQQARQRELAAERAASRASQTQQRFGRWAPLLLLLDLLLGLGLYGGRLRWLVALRGRGSDPKTHRPGSVDRRKPSRPRPRSRAPEQSGWAWTSSGWEMVGRAVSSLGESLPDLGRLPARLSRARTADARGSRDGRPGVSPRRPRRREPLFSGGRRLRPATGAMHPRRVTEMVQPDEPLRAKRTRHSVYDDLSL